jgi:hypothetical protein
MAVGASVSVLTTGYLLDPDTGLGWLGLGLSVLFTAMMQAVLRPYGRLRGLVTGEPVETPRQALNRLKGQATGLAQAAGLAQATGLGSADHIDTTAADAAPTAPDPAPATGTVTVRYRPTRPDDTPTWAREDDHDHEGGPEWTPTTGPAGSGSGDLAVPAWARDHDDSEHVRLRPDAYDRPTPSSTPARDHLAGLRPESIYQKGLLHEHLDQAEEYGESGFTTLDNGRIRYQGMPAPARTRGEMMGRRVVREWDPKTGRKRIWHETIDWHGRVRIVRPEKGEPKVHYLFDQFGKYEGTR